MERNEKKVTLWDKLKSKFRIIAIDPLSFHEKWSVKLSWLNLLSLLAIFSLLIGIISYVLVIYTPIGGGHGEFTREHRKIALENEARVKELENKLSVNYNRWVTLRQILNDSTITDTNLVAIPADTSKVSPQQRVSDSAFRALVGSRLASLPLENPGVILAPPTKGRVTQTFNPKRGHFGIDLSTGKEETVKTVLSGTVILKDWSSDDGHTLVVSHGNGLISIYKHNSILFPKVGDKLEQGKAIGKSGNTGSSSSGTHLHFELWKDGIPVNPEEYISF